MSKLRTTRIVYNKGFTNRLVNEMSLCTLMSLRGQFFASKSRMCIDVVLSYCTANCAGTEFRYLTYWLNLGRVNPLLYTILVVLF